MSEKILNVDYESEMGQSYVDYSMSVITERALPDVRDGLKLSREEYFTHWMVLQAPTSHTESVRE